MAPRIALSEFPTLDQAAAAERREDDGQAFRDPLLDTLGALKMSKWEEGGLGGGVHSQKFLRLWWPGVGPCAVALYRPSEQSYCLLKSLSEGELPSMPDSICLGVCLFFCAGVDENAQYKRWFA